MAKVTEIAPDVFNISTYIPEAGLQFNQFLLIDEEPLLFHTGLRSLFPAVLEAVTTVIEPARLRWIAFSHFEADECGALNDWLEVAPHALPACSIVGKVVSVDDVSTRPARQLADNQTFITGNHHFRFLQTPHVPHGWDAGLLFEETNRLLLCSDIFHQNGDVPATNANEEEVISLSRDVLLRYRGTVMDRYLPYTSYTDTTLQRLAALKPLICATMHGSTFLGDGERALGNWAKMAKEVLA